jgi:hypothetical protein
MLMLLQDRTGLACELYLVMLGVDLGPLYVVLVGVGLVQDGVGVLGQYLRIKAH